MMTRLYIFRKSVFTMAFAVRRIARNNIRAHQSTQRQILAVSLYLFVACIAAQADPFDLIQNTYLVAVRQRQEHAGTIEYLSRGGYELAGGKGINFAQWYQAKSARHSIRLHDADKPTNWPPLGFLQRGVR